MDPKRFIVSTKNSASKQIIPVNAEKNITTHPYG